VEAPHCPGQLQDLGPPLEGAGIYSPPLGVRQLRTSQPRFHCCEPHRPLEGSYGLYWCVWVNSGLMARWPPQPAGPLPAGSPRPWPRVSLGKRPQSWDHRHRRPRPPHSVWHPHSYLAFLTTYKWNHSPNLQSREPNPTVSHTYKTDICTFVYMYIFPKDVRISPP